MENIFVKSPICGDSGRGSVPKSRPVVAGRAAPWR